MDSFSHKDVDSLSCSRASGLRFQIATTSTQSEYACPRRTQIPNLSAVARQAFLLIYISLALLTPDSDSLPA